MVDNRDVAAHRADDDQRHRQLVLMQDWLDGFERIAADRAGGTYIACPPKGLLHRTEGSSIDGAIGAFRTTGSWPTITADSDARRKVQHYPLSISARALAHPAGSIETNRANVVQIEWVGFSADSPDEAADHLAWLGAEVVGPASRARGIPITCDVQFVGSDGYGTGAPQRLDDGAWLAYSGWLGHQHVPHNDHWDPGELNIAPILAAAGALNPAPVEVPDMTPGSCWTSDGHLLVFIVGTDHQAWYKEWDGHAYSAWIPLGGQFRSGLTAAASGTRIDVSGVGTDGATWHCFRENGAWFPTWQNLGGQAAAA
jgi:hypothetical protein